MYDDQVDRERRAAENQALFRGVNDRIRELNEVFDALLPYGSWACECDRLDCIQQIELTMEEYEALRSAPNRFAVVPGHFDPEVERVTEQSERYWIVEKVGAGAERAAELAAEQSEGSAAPPGNAR